MKEIATLEKGNIYFFYRPRVEEEDPQGKEDIQRFYVVLSAETPKDRCRLLVIGRKRLRQPRRSGHAREWGFVDLVRKDPKAIVDQLGEETYETKTRGRRHLPAARPCGEGVYRLLRHEDHTHLLYVLELPHTIREVQKDLGIEEEASYIISVKNPERDAPGGVGLDEERQAHFPKGLQRKFAGRKFADVDPADFLNHEGAEFVLISASRNIRKELGVELEAEAESAASADIFEEMRLDRKRRPIEPLLKGEWA